MAGKAESGKENEKLAPWRERERESFSITRMETRDNGTISELRKEGKGRGRAGVLVWLVKNEVYYKFYMFVPLQRGACIVGLLSYSRRSKGIFWFPLLTPCGGGGARFFISWHTRLPVGGAKQACSRVPSPASAFDVGFSL